MIKKYIHMSIHGSYEFFWVYRIKLYKTTQCKRQARSYQCISGGSIQYYFYILFSMFTWCQFSNQRCIVLGMKLKEIKYYGLMGIMQYAVFISTFFLFLQSCKLIYSVYVNCYMIVNINWYDNPDELLFILSTKLFWSFHRAGHVQFSKTGIKLMAFACFANEKRNKNWFTKSFYVTSIL